MALPTNNVMVPHSKYPYIDVGYRELPFNIAESMGGVDLNDPSEGLNVYTWKAWWDPVTEVIYIVHPVTSTLIPTRTVVGLQSLSFAFDTNMQPAIAYEGVGGSFIYFFDSSSGSFTTFSLPFGSRSMHMYHDIKRYTSLPSNTTDALLFYLRGDKLFSRQQRDRYAVEYQLATLASDTCRIRKLGLNSDYRIQMELTGENLFVSSP